MSGGTPAILTAYRRITGADDAASATEARNGAIHILSLTATKAADGLIDPKLVLAWLLNALGAHSAFVGALVPIREAGSMVPQIVLAGPVGRSTSRRWWWSAGSVLQGLAALGIGATAFTLSGDAAGWAIVLCLAVLAIARSLCSISYKDALARTIPKGRRGAISGAAASVSAIATLAFGTLLSTGLLPLTPTAIGSAILLAGGLWVGAAALFSRLVESAGDAAGDTDPPNLLEPLLSDAELRRFVFARSLLTATALAPPYILLASAQDKSGLGTLGPLVLASAAASIVSAYVWGRLSDRSSRLTLAVAGGSAALVLAAAAAASLATGGLGGLAGSALAMFFAQTAYEGVRAGRKLHVTDMARDAERPAYVALSNTIVGGVLILGGALGILADATGPGLVLAVLAAVCLAAVPIALSLREVQQTGGPD